MLFTPLSLMPRLLSPSPSLHPGLWESHPDHQFLRDPSRYRWLSLANGGPVWVPVPQRVVPLGFPFPLAASSSAAHGVVPFLDLETSIRLSWSAAGGASFFHAVRVAVVTRMSTADRVFCRACPHRRIASYRCDTCQSARCELCSRTAIARIAWVADCPPRALALCRQLRSQPNGTFGYRVCVPADIFPHGFITLSAGTQIDGFAIA